ncbi:MAG: UDP binding domain-containing protein, partial [Flavobacteriaceae bacterium]|nr:UDP binding domain-containing protein [Flavobacteriaceae bacterium]
KEESCDFKILNAVLEVNQRQKTILIPKIENYFNGALKGRKIALWGLAFKPETDDIREAPALDVIEALLAQGTKIAAFDPEAMPNVQNKLGDSIDYAQSMYEALNDADALVICTEWSIFRTPDFEKIKALLKTPVIFDGRNLYELEEVKQQGIDYFSIGR